MTASEAQKIVDDELQYRLTDLQNKAANEKSVEVREYNRYKATRLEAAIATQSRQLAEVRALTDDQCEQLRREWYRTFDHDHYTKHQEVRALVDLLDRMRNTTQSRQLAEVREALADCVSKADGRAPLTDEQKAALADFTHTMQTEVIPEVVETLRQRDAARHRTRSTETNRE